MKKRIVKFTPIFLLTLMLAIPAIAIQVKQIGWEDLVKKISFEDPFEALTRDQLGDLGIIARVRVLQSSGQKVDDYTLQEVKTATEQLEADGIDIDWLLSKREEIQELRKQSAFAVAEDLSGKQIRMAGYALPLEYSNTRITEFLLVPWVGACIHTPPPPPNQIVYVKNEHGIELKGRFTAVTVTGEMLVKVMKKNLYLVDGTNGIDVGYSLTASQVEPYKK